MRLASPRQGRRPSLAASLASGSQLLPGGLIASLVKAGGTVDLGTDAGAFSQIPIGARRFIGSRRPGRGSVAGWVVPTFAAPVLDVVTPVRIDLVEHRV